MTAYKAGVGFLAARPLRGRGGLPLPAQRAGKGSWWLMVAAFGFASSIPNGVASASEAPGAPPQKTKAAKSRSRKAAPKGSSAGSLKPPGPEKPEVPPMTSDALTERARLLFDAVVQGKPELADPFFFPREPFLPLKDVDDPGRYHAELVRLYHRDVLRLHAKRRSWEGARFVSFVLGSPPRWIEPGREWNKLGYYRTFDAKLAYEVSDAARTLIVRTIISWDGQWYVTHLTPTKH
jgi:hypothetical protein